MTNETEVKPEEVKEEAPERASQLVGGEIHIVADAHTGAIKVQSPPNLVVALGLLETAKAIMIQQHHENMKAAARPTIVRATASDIPKLVRPN